MADLHRLSITMDRDLYERLEQLLQSGAIQNRSEFFRDLLRSKLVQLEWEGDRDVVGAITLVYDHRGREVQKKLTAIQHQAHSMILANTHVHLTHDLCIEVIVVRGRADRIRDIADRIGHVKGVLYAEVSAGAISMFLAEEEAHAHP